MRQISPTSRLRLLCGLLFLSLSVLVYLTVQRARDAELARGSVLSTTEHLPGERGSIELLSAAYKINRMFQSMEGPSSNHAAIKLSPSRGSDEVVYVTGVNSEVVDADTHETVSCEFFCHANLTLNRDTTSPEQHNSGFDQPLHMGWRLVTLVPGCMGIRLPEGFGVPVKNGTLLDYFTMSLNQNSEVPAQTVRFKSRIDYTTEKSTRALFRRSVYIYQQYKQKAGEKIVANPAVHSGAQCGQSCSQNQLGLQPSVFVDLGAPLHPGATCCVANASDGGVLEQFGSNNTVHWMVQPGRHSFTTDVSPQMELPYDTTAHCVFGHLHPCGTALRLIDKKTARVIFEIKSEDFPDKVGVKSMTELISQEGIPLAKDGQYELVADYNNNTDHPIDAMAIMYLYLAESPDKSVILAGK